jgi:hypothetical protein
MTLKRRGVPLHPFKPLIILAKRRPGYPRIWACGTRFAAGVGYSPGEAYSNWYCRFAKSAQGVSR